MREAHRDGGTSSTGRLEGCLQGTHPADRLDGHLDSAGKQVARVFVWADCVGRPQIAGNLLLGRVRVDGDDRSGAVGDEGHQRGQAHATEPPDGSWPARAKPHSMANGAYAGEQGAAEERGGRPGDVGFYDDGRTVIHHGKLAECRDPEVVVDWFAGYRQSPTTAEEFPRAIAGGPRLAERWLIVPTGWAVAAGRNKGQHDVIPAPDAFDLGANLKDLAGRLMAEHHGGRTWTNPLDHREIRMAEASGLNFDEDFAGARRCEVKVNDVERSARLPQHCSPSLHAGSISSPSTPRGPRPPLLPFVADAGRGGVMVAIGAPFLSFVADTGTSGGKAGWPGQAAGGVGCCHDSGVSSNVSGRDSFAGAVEIPTRWQDVDLYGHVNNVAYYSYFDTAVNGWLIAHTGIDVRHLDAIGIVAQSSCTFLGSLDFPEVVEARLRVDRVGTSSVTYALGLFTTPDDQPRALGAFVHVYVDRVTRRPVPIPQAIRDAVTSLVLGEPPMPSAELAR